MLDHSQCLPWCGHLVAVQNTRINLALQREKLRRTVANMDREIDAYDKQIRELRAAGAN